MRRREFAARPGECAAVLRAGRRPSDRAAGDPHCSAAAVSFFKLMPSSRRVGTPPAVDARKVLGDGLGPAPQSSHLRARFQIV